MNGTSSVVWLLNCPCPGVWKAWEGRIQRELCCLTLALKARWCFSHHGFLVWCPTCLVQSVVPVQSVEDNQAHFVTPLWDDLWPGDRWCRWLSQSVLCSCQFGALGSVLAELEGPCQVSSAHGLPGWEWRASQQWAVLLEVF